MLTRLRSKHCLAVAFMALLFLGLATTLWAQEASAPTAAAPAAATTAPAPPKPDPAGTATGTIADVPAKVAGNPTLQEVAETVGHNKIAINMMWTLIAGFLVMFMQAGFAMVETGFCRAKNASHTMLMNFLIYAIGMTGYWILGFGLQMGGVGGTPLGGGTAGLLNPPQPRPPRQIEEQHQIQHNRRRQNRIAAQKIHFDLHRVAQPAKNVDVVPALFVVAARRVVVDAHLVVNLAVQIGIQVRLQNIFEHAEL